MSAGFNEQWNGGECVDVLDGHAVAEFPYEDVFERVDGKPQRQGLDYEAQGSEFRERLFWLLEPTRGLRPGWERATLKRLLGLALAIDPQIVTQSPPLLALARTIQEEARISEGKEGKESTA